MTPNDAYEIVKKQNRGCYAVNCLEYRDFYLFNMIPYQFIGRNDYVSGSIFDAVDKKTGKISKYDILSDVGAYNSAKVHKLNNIFDVPISSISKQ